MDGRARGAVGRIEDRHVVLHVDVDDAGVVSPVRHHDHAGVAVRSVRRIGRRTQGLGVAAVAGIGGLGAGHAGGKGQVDRRDQVAAGVERPRRQVGVVAGRPGARQVRHQLVPVAHGHVRRLVGGHRIAVVAAVGRVAEVRRRDQQVAHIRGGDGTRGLAGPAAPLRSGPGEVRRGGVAERPLTDHRMERVAPLEQVRHSRERPRDRGRGVGGGRGGLDVPAPVGGLAVEGVGVPGQARVARGGAARVVQPRRVGPAGVRDPDRVARDPGRVVGPRPRHREDRRALGGGKRPHGARGRCRIQPVLPRRRRHRRVGVEHDGGRVRDLCPFHQAGIGSHRVGHGPLALRGVHVGRQEADQGIIGGQARVRVDRSQVPGDRSARRVQRGVDPNDQIRGRTHVHRAVPGGQVRRGGGREVPEADRTELEGGQVQV